mgnify:FL=1
MPDLNSIIRWLKQVRGRERRAANTYKYFNLHQERVDMMTDLIYSELGKWADRNTEPGQLGPDSRKQEWKP